MQILHIVSVAFHRQNYSHVLRNPFEWTPSYLLNFSAFLWAYQQPEKQNVFWEKKLLTVSITNLTFLYYYHDMYLFTHSKFTRRIGKYTTDYSRNFLIQTDKILESSKEFSIIRTPTWGNNKFKLGEFMRLCAYLY